MLKFQQMLCSFINKRHHGIILAGPLKIASIQEKLINYLGEPKFQIQWTNTNYISVPFMA